MGNYAEKIQSLSHGIYTFARLLTLIAIAILAFIILYKRYK